MKAVRLDDPVHAPCAHLEAGLAEFLRNYVDRGVGIEEAVADDLANDLVGADIVTFGAGLVALEPYASMLTVEFEQLKISLFAELELRGGLGSTEPFAVAFNEHGQPGDDEVVGTNGEFTGGADDAAGRDVELHGLVLRSSGEEREAGLAVVTLEWITERGQMSLIDCGVFSPISEAIDQMYSISYAINY